MGINLANDDELRALADARIEQAGAGTLARRAAGTGRRAVDAATIAGHQPRRPPPGRSATGMPPTAPRSRRALQNAVAAQPGWDRHAGRRRAPRSWNTPPTCWKRACREYIALCVKEAGKTLPDGVAEVREAVDFLRYYAAQARAQFGAPERLPGPTGESNQLQLHGRGVFVCISPWNFPLAIFLGQVAAALAAGNTRDRQAGRADQPDRPRRGEAAARSRRARRTCCSSCPATAPSSARR